jgi:formylglycine-generating enzyme required for sulfatase activity
MELVLIPAGSFLMGSPDLDTGAGSDEKPQHEVRITRPFYLGKYEVTQEQWQAVVGTNPSRFQGPKNPVENVSWNDCQAFVKNLNDRHGGGGIVFGLPTEAQWEYACRAGSTARWCFGDSDSNLAEYAWYGSNSNSMTHPVGQKKPNAWGLHDMHGNVSEWCVDWYGSKSYAVSPADDPSGPDSGTSRVLRGGCWFNWPSDVRSAVRGRGVPGGRVNGVGFRVARTP